MQEVFITTLTLRVPFACIYLDWHILLTSVPLSSTQKPSLFIWTFLLSSRGTIKTLQRKLCWPPWNGLSVASLLSRQMMDTGLAIVVVLCSFCQAWYFLPYNLIIVKFCDQCKWRRQTHTHLAVLVTNTTRTYGTWQLAIIVLFYLQFVQGKSLFNPLPFILGLLHPLNYETVCFTPWTFYDRLFYPLGGFQRRLLQEPWLLQ